MAQITKVRPLAGAELDALEAARLSLIGAPGYGSREYYGIALFKTHPLAAEGLGTWAVDKHWRMYIDPQCLPGGTKGWTAPDCADVIEHELGHLLRAHDERMHLHKPNVNPKRANVAGDMEINDDTAATSFVRTIGHLPSTHGLPDGQTMEWYYDRLPHIGGAGGSQTGAAPGNGNGSAGDPSMGPCGSGAGNRIDGELDADDPRAPVVSPGEAELARRSVAEAIQERMRQHGRGSVPGGIAKWADVLLTPPKIPWQQTLRSAARHGVSRARGAHDYTYSRISRRNAGTNVILPGTYSPQVSVDAIVDVSGSMSDAMVFEALSEVEGVARAAEIRGDRLRLIQVDAAVGSVDPVFSLSRVRLTGRGGTDMRVGLAKSDSLTPRASVQIVLTDGDTPTPTEAPARGVHQIWVLIQPRTGLAERHREAMPWADVLVAE